MAKAATKTIWDANPSMKKYYKTSDGNKFYSKADAKLHAVTAKLEDREIETVNRPAPKLNAEERIEAIKAMETVEEVQAALKDEKASTVKAAGEARIKELS